MNEYGLKYQTLKSIGIIMMIMIMFLITFASIGLPLILFYGLSSYLFINQTPILVFTGILFILYICVLLFLRR